MVKFFNLLKIFLLYGLTAPTNVMCLGAFTESWLKGAQLTRLDLANSYLLATICVFFVLQGQKYFEESINIKACFGCLGISCIILILSNSLSMLSLFSFFFFVQWFGQGLIIEECRVLLSNTMQGYSYSLAAGCLEAWGTFLVYAIPFCLLYILKEHTWQFSLIALGMIYIIISLILKQKSLVIPRTDKLFGKIWTDKRFLIANVIIYLPVLLTSGLFFHLEAFIDRYQLSTEQLEICILPQILVSIGLQIALGFFAKDNQKRLMGMFSLLFISQVLWLVNLLFVRGYLFCWFYTLTGAIGWGCFGLLVNITWKFLFNKDCIWTEACLRNSVNFGFLANAAGPLLFILFL